MSVITPSVAAAMVISVAVPAVISAATRRSDRGRKTSGAFPDPKTGALFQVVNRRWQPILFRVLGLVFLIIGVFFSFISLVAADEMSGPGPAIAAASIAVFGALFLVISIGVKRSRVLFFSDRFTIRPWFKAERTVPVTEIGVIKPAQNRFGGVDVRDTRKKMLFTATTLHIGYDQVIPFLEEQAPKQWAEFIAVYG